MSFVRSEIQDGNTVILDFDSFKPIYHFLDESQLQNIVIKTDKRQNGIRTWQNIGDKVKVVYDGRLDDWSLQLFDLKTFDGIFVKDHEVLKTILANQSKFVKIIKNY